MRLATRVGVTVMATVGLVASQLSAASAVQPHTSSALWPTGCSTRYDAYHAWAYCSGGGGVYQVLAKCSGSPSTRYGAWVYPGNRSAISCGTDRPTWAGINLRSG